MSVGCAGCGGCCAGCGGGGCGGDEGCCRHSRRSRCCGDGCGGSGGNKQCLRTCLLLVSVLAGVALGLCLRTFTTAFTLSPARERHIMYLTFPAELVMRLAKMLGVPVIVTGLISSVPEVDRRSSGAKLALSVCGYYLYTTVMALGEGVLFVMLIKPGVGHASGETENASNAAEKTYSGTQQVDALLDMLRNSFPDNLVLACFQMSKTVSTFETKAMSHPNTSFEENSTLHGLNDTVMYEKLSIGHYEGMNILGLATFSLLFGVALRAIGPSGNHLSSLVGTVFEALMKILMMLIWTFPLTIILLIASTMVRLDNPAAVFIGLLYYVITVITGLAVHVLFVLPLSYIILTRKNPVRFMMGLSQAMVTAFGTSNSLATLPITIDCVERNGVDSRIARMVLPLGATVNMDGTALYEAVAVLFVAQMRGMSPTPVQILIMCIIATVVSIGAPAMGGGLISMIIVFQSLGLDISDLFILLVVDFILGRCRTMTNVIGDAFCAGVISHVCRGTLHDIDHKYLYEDHEQHAPTLMTFTARRDNSDVKVANNQNTLTMENEDGEKLIITRL